MNTALKTTLTSFALLAGSMSIAQANTGKFDFIGSIHEGACSITPESAEQLVDFGPVAKHVLAEGGSTQVKSIKLELEDCDVTVGKTVTASFTGADSADVPGALALQGVTGAGIMLTDYSGKPIVFGTPTTKFNLQNGNNTMLFGAAVKGSLAGTITTGNFSAVTNFTLSYL